jgi:hypothetical protein
MHIDALWFAAARTARRVTMALSGRSFGNTDVLLVE